MTGSRTVSRRLQRGAFGPAEAAAFLGIALLMGCGDDVGIGGGTTGMAPSSSSASSPSSSSDAAPPRLLATPGDISPGGLAYAVFDAPLASVTLSLRTDEATHVLEPELFLMTDEPGALYRIPPGLTDGEAAFELAWNEAPELYDTAPVEIRSAPFSEVSAELGLDVTHNAVGSPEACAESHTGLAWGDIDNDGSPEVFFGNVGRGGTLHRADTPGAGFENITAAAGLADIDAVSMAMFIDIEGDGDLDLFVGRRGANRLFENQYTQSGTATFVDVTSAWGLGVESQRTMGAAFGDYDNDGDLDLYVVNHAFCFPQTGSEVRARDHLYRNDGEMFVPSVAIDADVLESVGFSAAWLDTDRDGDLDLIVINDDVGGEGIGYPNTHWRNDGPALDEEPWRFREVGEETGIAIPGVNGMGLAFGDLNDDGFVDLGFTNIGANQLLLSRGDGTFDNATDSAGIGRARLGWGRQSITWAIHFLDHDNDGDEDIYVSGGRIKGSIPVVDGFFDNVGSNTFEERTWSSGMLDPESGKASALVDFDRDGDWDIVTTAWGSDVRVYRNDAGSGSGHHFVEFHLQGAGANAAAIGAIVELDIGGETRTCFYGPRPSLGGGGEATCHFGLGTQTQVDALRVQWPSGVMQDMDVPALDARTVLVQAP